MVKLTVSGDIPGLLRRGSPVPHPRAADIPCVVVACHTNDRTAVVGYPWPVNHEQADSWPLSMLALDLTDATGRAHAAWWLADRLYPNDCPYLTAAVLPGSPAMRPGKAWGISTLSVHDGERWREFDVGDALDGCGVLDPRTLPDGSRFVDAEALRRVVLYVAGRTP